MTIAEDASEAVLKQVMRLVDLSCDLERNREDSTYVKKHGGIHYVFDTNIFEMFIRPFRHREAVETFYADVWSSHARTVEGWRSFECQAALVASEFLVSTPLPGNADDNIYMTEYHRWELAQRNSDSMRDLWYRAQVDSDQFQAELDTKLKVIDDLLSPGQNRTKVNRTDPLLQADLAKLREAGSPQDVLDRVLAARTAASFLAEDRHTEPLDQLRRAVTFPIRQKIKSLQSQYRPAPKELETIEREAERWFRLFIAELQKPGHRNRLRATLIDPSRDESGHSESREVSRALMNDARSVAYLRWLIGKQSSIGRRIIFITGDPILFDAYRRWYVGDENPPSPGEPFFMRRVTQYSPIFNPYDTRGDLRTTDSSKTSLLFDKIQQVVETSLIPFAKAFITEAPNRFGGVNRQRELLALKLIDQDSLTGDEQLKPFTEKLTETWLLKQRDEMESLRDLWQEAQRANIGASYDLVVSRLNDEQKILAKNYVSASSEEAGELLSKYVANILEQLLEGSVQLWVPLAVSLATDEFPDQHWKRAPIKRLSLALDLDLINKKCEGLTHPDQYSVEILFALAAMKALERQDVSNAQRFTNLALTAEQMVQGRDPDSNELQFELRYLHAVAHRMALATISSHLRSTSTTEGRRTAATRAIAQLHKLFSMASTSIRACILEHFEKKEASETHRIKYLRAVSEQASLNLFMATALGMTHPTVEEGAVKQSLNYLEKARADLRTCEIEDKGIENLTPVLKALREQYIPNIACFEVLASILLEGDYAPTPWPKRLLREISQFWETTEVHALLSAELTAWSQLMGMSPPKGKAMSAARVKKEFADLRLPLDRVLFKAITRAQ